MSEYTKVDIGFKDKNCLVKTLEELGYKPQVHSESIQLKGYRGDSRVQRAHIVIPRSQVGAAANDVGFELVDGEYVMHVSQYDKTKKKLNPNRLKQLYAKYKVKSTVSRKSNKYRIKSEKVDKEGRIKIKLSFR